MLKRGITAAILITLTLIPAGCKPPKHPYASDRSMPVPERFMIPGTDNAWHIAFMPDGNTYYFVTSENGRKSVKYSEFIGGGWSMPKPADFSVSEKTEAPSISPDGLSFFFARATRIDSMEHTVIFCMKRTCRGWGEPKILGKEINATAIQTSPSMSQNGTLYFISDRDGELHVYRSRQNNGIFGPAEPLDRNVNALPVDEFCVAPDEGFLIFGRRMNLYITFRSGESWTAPKSLGSSINTAAYEGGPCITPDGRYLFFSRRDAAGQNISMYQVDLPPLLVR